MTETEKEETDKEIPGPRLGIMMLCRVLDIRETLPERIAEDRLEEVTAVWTTGAGEAQDKKGCSSLSCSALFERHYFEKIEQEFPNASLFLYPEYYNPYKDTAVLVVKLRKKNRWILLAPVILT